MAKDDLLEVCFSASLGGTLKTALGKCNRVVYLFDGMDVGDISHKNIWTTRKKQHEFLYGECSRLTQARLLHQEKKRFRRILKHIKHGGTLRIWVSSTPYELCGYYLLSSLLLPYDFPAYLMRMPQGAGYRDVDADCFWCELLADKIPDFLHLSHEISREERQIAANEWKRLHTEGSGLRIRLADKIVSVCEDYFDEAILHHISPYTEISMGKAIVTFIGASKHYLHITFIESRIRTLADDGYFTIEHIPLEKGIYGYSDLIHIKDAGAKEIYQQNIHQTPKGDKP